MTILINSAMKIEVVSKLLIYDTFKLCYILGFLCGKCPHGSGNEVIGLAFNLLECTSCKTADRIWFVFICKLN